LLYTVHVYASGAGNLLAPTRLAVPTNASIEQQRGRQRIIVGKAISVQGLCKTAAALTRPPHMLSR